MFELENRLQNWILREELHVFVYLYKKTKGCYDATYDYFCDLWHFCEMTFVDQGGKTLCWIISQ